jgi:hypothetical protein
MLGAYGGDKKAFSDTLGYYGDFDISVNTIDETGTSKDSIYAYTNINGGIVWNF